MSHRDQYFDGHSRTYQNSSHQTSSSRNFQNEDQNLRQCLINSQGTISSINTPIDISNSNLQPTAAEFTPSTSTNRSAGAIKKNHKVDNKFKRDHPKKFVRTFGRNNVDLNDAESNFNRVRINEDNGRDNGKDNGRDNGKDIGRDTVRDNVKDNGRDNGRDSGRDFGRDNGRDNVKDNGRDNIRDNGRDNGRNYDNKNREPKKKFNNGDKFKGNYRGNNGFYNNSYYNNRDNYRKNNGERKTDNWRQQKVENQPKEEIKVVEKTSSANPRQLQKKFDAASQRERLEQMVSHRILECLVCCERLRHTDKIWSCKQCYHILHLNCVIRWAKASKLEEGWRCPACQNVSNQVPNEYRCYCDKFKEPKLEPGGLPHSCGEVCGRKGRSCVHTCTLLCHPGPCPDCNITVIRPCGCGATKPYVICSSDIQIVCQGLCNKPLNCLIHKCEKKCHVGACGDCENFVKQECFCGKVGRKVRCTAEVQGVEKYECGEVCGKVLSCGNHKCSKLCHDGPCEICPVSPEVIKTCPCGKTSLAEERKSCLDPIPCCDKVCNKRLKCGQPNDPHLCKEKCHAGNCPTCPLTTFVRCRCGHMDRELACKELTTKADDARCQKKCSKKRLCCKHKCNQMCCIEVEHICPLPCNRLLSCGQHRCDQTCHRGHCAPCWRTSFEELYCECGASVLYPPVACGTRPPPCSKPCSRDRLCGHQPNHTCHSGPCPPCAIFTSKYCHGKHEIRQTIPCYQEDFSCGLPCNKELSCGRHKCIQTCHKGPCPSPCNQPCVVPRINCEHNCNLPCHDPPCPPTHCKKTVVITCQCGLRTGTRPCVEVIGEYQQIAMTQIAAKMAETGQSGETIDITDIISKKKGGTHKMLECNEECRIVERNRRLAIGLQIRNPDLSAKLTPKYSEYMRGWAKKDSRFCQHVHDKLTELVQLAKQSKQKSRSHSFECMNRDKRHFVHEYCEHFGVESAAFDKEPNRNIIATANREKSWLPSLSLLELMQRENGQRKVPGPVLNKDSGRSVLSKPGESVSWKLQSRVAPKPPTHPGEFVDYFDFNP